MSKPKAAIYCRVSTDKQFDKGGSLETQENNCRSYCERNDYEIVEVYKDVESGGTLKRDQIQRLFADAEAGRFEMVVVTKIDRLSRSMRDYYSKIINFEKYNVRIAAIDQPEFSTAGATGNFLRNILLAAAEFERDMIRQRTAEGMRAKIAKGEWHGGPLPLGYINDKENKKLIVDEDKVQLVKQIFDTYLRTKSSGDTAEVINNEGYRTQKGKKFTKKGILRIVQNQVYIGKLKMRLMDGTVEITDGLHDAIIDEEAFKQASLIREENSLNTYKNKVLPSELLFNSLLRCGHCDSAMTPHPTKRRGKKIYYYRCINAVNHGSAVCPLGQIASADIELHGITLLRLLSLDEELLKSVLKKASVDNSIIEKEIIEHLERLKKNKSLEKEKIDNLLNFLAKFPEDNLAVVKEKIDELQNNVHSIEHNMNALEVDLKKIRQPIQDIWMLKNEYEYFWYLWRQLKFEDRKKAVRILINGIKLYSTGKRNGDKLYRMEIELVTNAKIRTSTGVDGSSGDKVRFSETYGDPIVNNLQIIKWLVILEKTACNKRGAKIKIEVSDPAFALSPIREQYQEILLQEAQNILNSGKKSEPIVELVQELD